MKLKIERWTWKLWKWRIWNYWQVVDVVVDGIPQKPEEKKFEEINLELEKGLDLQIG